MKKTRAKRLWSLDKKHYEPTERVRAIWSIWPTIIYRLPEKFASTSLMWLLIDIRINTAVLSAFISCSSSSTALTTQTGWCMICKQIAKVAITRLSNRARDKRRYIEMTENFSRCLSDDAYRSYVRVKFDMAHCASACLRAQNVCSAPCIKRCAERRTVQQLIWKMRSRFQCEWNNGGVGINALSADTDCWPIHRCISSYYQLISTNSCFAQLSLIIKINSNSF